MRGPPAGNGTGAEVLVMKQIRISAVVAALALAVASGASCRIQGKQQPFTVMDGNGEVLRAAFNADALVEKITV